MFLLFGKSMHPALRLIIAVAILVIGIVAHLELMEIAGAAYAAFSVFLLGRKVKQINR
jgi:hypothetical protein